MPRIELPRDQWADFRDLDSRPLKQRDRKKWITGFAGQVDSKGNINPLLAGLDMGDGLICLMVEAWSLTGDDGSPLPLPRTNPTVLEDLDIDIYDALSEATQPIMDQLGPDAGRTVDARDGDPNSPTGASNG